MLPVDTSPPDIVHNLMRRSARRWRHLPQIVPLCCAAPRAQTHACLPELCQMECGGALSKPGQPLPPRRQIEALLLSGNFIRQAEWRGGVGARESENISREKKQRRNEVECNE